MADIEVIKSLIDTALKKIPADLVLKEAQILDVFSGKMERKDIAIKDGYIAALGEGFKATETINIKGAYLLPGYIDAHIHLESTLITPIEFCKAVLPRGTTCVISDPHEIANVMGVEGIRYLLRITEELPIDFFFTAPSCVPATSLETSGAKLGLKELDQLLQEERIVGLGEMMNYPGVISKDEEVLKKIILALEKGKRVDGHAPGLQGEELCAYVSCGISSDHECVHLKEAEEKLKRGMYIMIREGSTAKNMSALIPLVRAYGISRFMLVCDDRHPQDLADEGHIDFLLKKAVSLGIAPNLAVRMVTFNPAFYFNLRRKGAVAPGYEADLVVVDDLREFFPRWVIKKGKVVAHEGKLIIDLPSSLSEPPPYTLNIKLPKNPFVIKAKAGKVRIIKIIPSQIVTEVEIERPKVENENIVSDTQRDLLKIAVVERHHGTGNVGLGLVRGFGLKSGAIASSVAHDSHNIVVVGCNDKDMLAAIKAIEQMKGGLVVVENEKILASLSLPLGGLISLDPLASVIQKLKNLNKKVKELGTNLDSPFMTLSFLALPVIPKLKITDLGLVDVETFSIVDLFIN